MKTTKPWSKPNPMARKCAYCGSQKPGMQPLRLNGKRGYWHLKCFEKARKEVNHATGNKPTTPLCLCSHSSTAKR